MADTSPKTQAEEKADAVDLSTPQSPEKDLEPKTEDFERLFESAFDVEPEIQDMETQDSAHDVENPAPETAGKRGFYPRGSTYVIRRTRVRRRSPAEEDESFTFMLLYIFFLAVLGFWLIRTSAQMRWRKKFISQHKALYEQQQRAQAKISQKAKRAQEVAAQSIKVPKVKIAGELPPKQAEQEPEALTRLGELIAPIEDAAGKSLVNSSMSRSECIKTYSLDPSDPARETKLNDAMKRFRKEAPALVRQLEKVTLSKQDKELISSWLNTAFFYDYQSKGLDTLVSGSEGSSEGMTA